MTVKKTYRISEEAVKTIARIVKEKKMPSDAAVIENALKLYSDYVYMQEHATIIPQEIIRILQSTVVMAEQRINNKTNQVLSSLAVETGILEQIIANSLDVDLQDIKKYRQNTIEFQKTNQRIFRLDEVL